MLLRDLARLKACIYDAAWQRLRKSRPGHKALSDNFLWHDFYEQYVNALPLGGPLVEAHLRIVLKIAGQIAHRRFPTKFGANQAARDGQNDIIHELAATGVLGLIEAVEHWDPEKGAFSTIANYWIRKRIREGYGRGIFGIGGFVQPLYRPKRHVPTFAVGLVITKSVNKDQEDEHEIDFLDADGRTSREYLQRHVGEGGARFLWRDEGAYATPRLKLPGHINGRASEELVCEPERALEQRNRFVQDGEFLEHAKVVAEHVLSPIELRVFKARFLNKRKPTHAALAVELNRSEAGIRRIKARAAKKIWAAKPIKPDMAAYYSLQPLSDPDEWLDLTKRKAPEATQKDRLVAHRMADAYRHHASDYNLNRVKACFDESLTDAETASKLGFTLADVDWLRRLLYFRGQDRRQLNRKTWRKPTYRIIVKEKNENDRVYREGCVESATGDCRGYEGRFTPPTYEPIGIRPAVNPRPT